MQVAFLRHPPLPAGATASPPTVPLQHHRPVLPCAPRPVQVHGAAAAALLGPLASTEDEQEVNDALGQLLMVMQILDDEIGEWGRHW